MKQTSYRSQTTADTIRAAYQALAPQPGDFVSLAQLRELVPATDFDTTVVAMYRSQEINLTPEAAQWKLTPADRAAAVRCGGEDKHKVSIEPAW
jgi:hypothetical protein